jgi:hypothetical protein
MIDPTRKTETIRVPASLRSVITTKKLAANDIAVLLLIAERTLDNVFPRCDDTALSIRYIAEQNGASPKGAENSVKKLKTLNLITHDVSHGTFAPGMMGLNLSEFRESVRGRSKVKVSDPGPLRADGDGVACRRQVGEDIQGIREMLYQCLNKGRKKREPELPDPFLAAELLDRFGTSDAVERWVRSLHSDKKRKRWPIKGYGFYAKLVHRLRDQAI